MRTVARALAHSLMSGLFATALVFTACGDDDDGGTTDTAQTETAQETSQETVAPPDTTPGETAAETTEDTAVPPDTTPETTEDTTPGETTAEGACTNAADLAIITSGDKDPGAKASECGAASCIATLFTSIDDFETCVDTCMKNAALPGYEFVVSDACTTCYVKSVRCTAEFCGLSDPNQSCVPTSFGGKGADSADCAQCREDNNCTSSFFTCSGLTPE